MKHLYVLLILATMSQAETGSSPLNGRWDLNVTSSTATYPNWLECNQTAGKAAVRIQPRSGSVREASVVKIGGSHLIASLPTASGNGTGLTWDLTANGDQINGTLKRGETEVGQITGVRAPALKRAMPKKWSKPEALLDDKDLTGWEPSDPANNHWVVQDSVLLNEKHGANLRTTRKFDDFKLHIEYNCPAEGNSGIYLRGRYEVQVEYELPGANDRLHQMGSVYGFIAPSVVLPKKPGEWESYDITLVGRYLTVVRDGVKIIDDQEIPGITGGALDSNEGQPGPFYLQGDHTGGMKYKNITVSLPGH